jgi:electron transfer flavoprotein alpha/beta subunit
MSNFIVLVKQVPDVSQITDNAFDPNTGTLIRTRLASVINELDTQALAFANRMRQLNGSTRGKIVALTMGPPMAEEVLRYSLSRCADAVVLLTDKALGGADTVATANPLAWSIRKIVKEIFGGDNDYYIVAGMQSVDGDTAQVPPQIAEELGLSCIAYVTDCELKNGRFEFTRIISGGSQIVAARRPPAVITVAKYEHPLFATFAGTRCANRIKVMTWGSGDINATLIGVKGSKTTVIRVFPPGKSSRKCQRVADVKSLASVLIESVKSAKGDIGTDRQIARYALPARRKGKLDRSFESTAKEVEDFKILSDKLRELGITDAGGIDEQVKEKTICSQVCGTVSRAIKARYGLSRSIGGALFIPPHSS